MGERGVAGQMRAESVQVAISTAKNALWTSSDIAEKGHRQLQGIDPAVLADIFDVYERQLRCTMPLILTIAFTGLCFYCGNMRIFVRFEQALSTHDGRRVSGH